MSGPPSRKNVVQKSFDFSIPANKELVFGKKKNSYHHGFIKKPIIQTKE
jgi:hypothetical protein